MNLHTIFSNALSYNAYRKLIDELILEGKTTGDNQNESLLNFTKLNIQRMNRIDKTIEIDPNTQNKLKQINHRYSWLLIGDAWCGDCAQIIPVINKLIELNPKQFELRIISRDTFPELIEKFQTNGTKSIPKLLMMDANNYEVINNWGPRPQGANNILLKWKANKDKMSKEDFEKELHLWYAKDKGVSIIQEISSLIK